MLTKAPGGRRTGGHSPELGQGTPEPGQMFAGCAPGAHVAAAAAPGETYEHWAKGLLGMQYNEESTM